MTKLSHLLSIFPPGIRERVVRAVAAIRARKRARDLKNNDLFRGLVGCFRHQPVTVHDLDEHGRIVFANEMACAYFGVDIETLLSWTPHDFDPGAKPVSKESLDIFTEIGSYVFETNHRIYTGELIPVEVTSNYFQYRHHRYSICMSRDLRPEREAEARRLEIERVQLEQEGVLRLARFASGAPGFMYIRERRMNGDEVLTYASPASLEVLGISNEMLTQNPDWMFKFVIAPDKARILEAERASAMSLSAFHEEYQYVHPAKGIRWLENRAVTERLENGTIAWYGHIHEITQRKISEQYLEETRARLQSVLSTIPDPVWMKDNEGIYLTCNQAFERLFGKQESEVIGNTDYALFEPSWADSARKRDREALENSGIVIHEAWFNRAQDGKQVLVETRSVPVRNPSGQVMGVLGIGRDISQRHALQAALAQRERDFRLLAENAPDNIVRYDLETRILYANPSLVNNLGIRSEMLVGQTGSELFPDSEAMREYDDLLRQVIKTGTPAEYEMQVSVGSEALFLHDLIRIAPEFDEGGRVCGAIAIGRSIKEQKRLERELSQREADFRTLAENSPDMIIRYDLDCRRIYVNDAFLRATGSRPEDILGKPITAIGWWSINCSAQEFENQLRSVIQSGKPVSVQLFGYVPTTNQARHTLARVVPEYDPAGKVKSLLAFVRDVTDMVQLQIDIAERERQFRTLIENTPDVLIRYGQDLRRMWVSHNYERVYGRPWSSVIGTRPSEAWGRPTMPSQDYEAHLQRVLDTGVPESVELDWYNEEGDYVCQSLRLVPEYDTLGQVCSVLALSRDVSAIKRASLRLLAREQEFRTLVEHSPDTICRYDLGCKRVYANPKMIELFGVGSAWVLNKTPLEFPGGESSYAYEKHIRHVIESGETINFEMNWNNGTGKSFCTHLRLSPEFDANGLVTGVLAVGRDISEIDEYRRRVHHMAFYDALTNMPNRALLNDRLGQVIVDAQYHGHRFGLMVLDLDGFKEVNDTLGHAAGDALLETVAERLQTCVRIYDTVARLGGDEFAILLPEVREDENLAGVASKILQSLSEPCAIGGKEVFISASIGIVVYPSDSADIDGLFRYADSAMYHAKRQGRNNYQFYSSEMTERASERMGLESALRRAVRQEEFALHFQPQMDMVSGQLIGAEALLRWESQDLGKVTPDRFIPIAEETGLIVGIGEWVLTTACATAVRWNSHRKHPLKIAVNLSSRQFVRNDLLNSVRRILAETGCRPQWLCLEITESLLLGDSEDIQWILREFDAMGLSIAIDDFGTGYSALGYLNRFPIKTLKIDRSFVKDITTDRDRAELVKAIISMARSLRKTLVAEGVETDVQAAYLNNLGCHIIQGFLFGRPMPIDEFEANRLHEELQTHSLIKQQVH